MIKLTETETKQLSSQLSSWYLKSEDHSTWFVHRTGKYSLDEISEILDQRSMLDSPVIEQK